MKDRSVFAYKLREEIGTVIIGQRYLIDRLLIGLLANGHVLLEGARAKVQSALLEAMRDDTGGIP